MSKILHFIWNHFAMLKQIFSCYDATGDRRILMKHSSAEAWRPQILFPLMLPQTGSIAFFSNEDAKEKWLTRMLVQFRAKCSLSHPAFILTKSAAKLVPLLNNQVGYTDCIQLTIADIRKIRASVLVKYIFYWCCCLRFDASKISCHSLNKLLEKHSWFG